MNVDIEQRSNKNVTSRDCSITYSNKKTKLNFKTKKQFQESWFCPLGAMIGQNVLNCPSNQISLIRWVTWHSARTAFTAGARFCASKITIFIVFDFNTTCWDAGEKWAIFAKNEMSIGRTSEPCDKNHLNSTVYFIRHSTFPVPAITLKFLIV